MGKEPRDKGLKGQGPSPADYSLPSHTKAGPKYHMGVKTNYDRKPLATHTGPGDYNPNKSKHGISNSYTMGARPSGPSDKRHPGPGEYESEDYYKKIKGSKMDQNVRDTSVDHKSVYSPGPSQSVMIAKEAKNNAGPKYSFGSEARDKGYISRAKSAHPPGPGDYNHKHIVGGDGPGYSMPGRRPDVRVLPGKEGRGPGSYNSNHSAVKRNGSQYSMGKTQKGHVPDVYGHTPAPNQYDPNDAVGKNKSAVYGMGSGSRPPLSQVLETPGPGTYNDQKKKVKGPTMPGKEKAFIKPSPGPGEYTPIDGTVKKKAAKFSMGTQKKDLLPCKVTNANPGAGSYH